MNLNIKFCWQKRLIVSLETARGHSFTLIRLLVFFARKKMAKNRMINTKFWIDTYISELEPSEKLLFLYFLTNPYSEICGVYEIPIKYISLETGLDVKIILKIIEKFEKDEKIFYENGWVAIKNFAKHQLDNPSIKIGVVRSLSLAPKNLVDKIQSVHRLPTVTDSQLYLNLNLNSNLKSTEQSSETIKERKLKQTERPFVYSDELEKMKTSNRKVDRIVALYWIEKNYNFENWDQYKSNIGIDLHQAVLLKGYNSSQVKKVIEFCKEDSLKNHYEWKLSTVVKKIPGIINSNK